ncbi:hypothetical protein JD292_11620 [Leucobacter sp. CSA2]|uniref:Uncharacterized protein n=1 Tax=Leucobacter edaphi TaxID=2796472 RepID=A0A934UY15_9MICO|nr:DUF6882 domain-containing protein [Leucobacter edaphi]MBK0422720.1 hypothetical protein [Leucobacter edaphi]
MSFDQISALANRAALYSMLRQDQLVEATEALGDHRWDVDLAANEFTFQSNTDPEQKITAVPYLLASIAPGPRSLVWARALPQGDPSGITEVLAQYGRDYGIEGFAADEIQFPEDTGDDIQEWMAIFAHQLGRAATLVTGKSPYFTAGVGGSRILLLLDAPLPALTVSEATTRIPRLMSQAEIPDPRTGLWEAARLAGWKLEWTDDAFSGATISDETGNATFTFDENANITGITGELRGASS